MPDPKSPKPVIRQVAVLPYRIGESGEIQILLITSRRTGRWVIPKGNRISGLSSHKAAAQEAFEEAGVSGIASPKLLGVYKYDKMQKNGSTRTAVVKVYAFAFDAQSDIWPEQAQRDTQWFGLDEAVAAVDEPELKTIISTFVA